MSHPPENAGYDTIDTLFRHNVWANENLFAACAGLSDEQLDATVPGTYGSIRDTLRHIARAEQAYLHRVTTGQPYPWPENAPPPTIADLQESIRRTGEGFVVAAPQVLAQDDVEVNWDGVPRRVPSAAILTQVINHATEHRAQIMTIMSQIGIEPPELDGWSYFDARDRGAAT